MNMFSGLVPGQTTFFNAGTRLHPICNRAQVANVAKSTGSNQTVSYRTSLWSTKQGAVSALQVIYTNNYIATTGEEDGEATNFLIKGALEYNGAFYRLFFRGSRIGTVEPGAILVSDPVGVRIPAGSNFFLRTRMSCNNLGEKWATSVPTNGSIGEGWSASPNDQADATGVLTGNGTAGSLMPAAILGRVDHANPSSVVIIGSSSGFGQGDTAEAPTYDLGYLARIVNNNVGSMKLARGSTTVAQWITDASRRRALLGLVRPTHCLWQLGTNDISGGAAFATVQANLLSAWNDLSALGIQVWAQTFTAVTSSTDNWATLANQTIHAHNTVRQQINEWIRTTPAPLAGYLEIADLTETARNSGLWKVDGTANKWTVDGTHCSQYAHQQIALATPLSTIGIL